jgi:hypothetical protein
VEFGPTPSDAPCAVIRRLARVTGEVSGTPNLLFLCESYWSALAGWHHMASGLVRPRMDTNRLRSPSDRRARKCGGVSGSRSLRSVTFRHAINCFGVRAGRMGSVHQQTANSTCVRARRPRAGRQPCDWLAVWTSANRDGTQRPLDPELRAGAALTAMSTGGPRWSCCTTTCWAESQQRQCREPS